MKIQLPERAMSAEELRNFVIKRDKEQVLANAEDLRSRMDPSALMQQMLGLYTEADCADEERLEQLKFKAGILTVMLKKCMPDLRALEVAEKSNNYSKLIIDLQRSESSAS
jgi:hypothetical protein